MTHLEQRLAEALAREEEAKAHREEILAREEDGMLEQVEALAGRVEGLQEEVNRRKEETAEVGVARQLLLEQLEEREQERREAESRLAEAEQRITALQVKIKFGGKEIISDEEEVLCFCGFLIERSYTTSTLPLHCNKITYAGQMHDLCM